MLKGRLGLAAARVPHADRHGLLWLGRGNLLVEDGTLRFATAGYEELPAGDYAIPYQMVSSFILEPGTSITHDALRILARHGCTVLIVGEGAVRYYASLPSGPGRSAMARRHAELWSDSSLRQEVILQLYEWRLGERLEVRDLNALRGIEGVRVKESYRQIAKQYGIRWRARRYDRSDPEAADRPNRALHHAAAAVKAAAMTAVAASGALPELGFIHEDASIAFPLDIADLYREEVTLPIAFGAVQQFEEDPEQSLERLVRKRAVKVLRQQKLVAKMIDRIQELLGPELRSGTR
ncbi:MAG: type I-E CRISPR-associated endonuclease Cas1e [Acidobacteriota bacterium]